MDNIFFFQNLTKFDNFSNKITHYYKHNLFLNSQESYTIHPLQYN